MKRNVLLGWGAAVLGITMLFAGSALQDIRLVAPPMFGLCVLGWIVAVYGPMTLAVLFWSSSRARSSVVANLLFILAMVTIIDHASTFIRSRLY